MKSIGLKYFLLTVILFVIMFLPRFNGNQNIVKQEPYDSKYFKAYVEYFRGEIVSNEIRPATNWRFLVPLMASWLPFTAYTSINTINLFFLSISLFIFFRILSFYKIKNNKKWQNIWLFIVSFPMFYYSSIGYVDASLFFFIALSIYATVKDNIWLFLISILLGLCVKEIILISIPFYFFYHYSSQSNKAIWMLLSTLFLYFLLYWIIKTYAPITNELNKNNFWKFDFKNATTNFNRLNTWLSFIFSFGMVGLLFLNQIFKLSIKNILGNNLIIACLSSILTAYGLYLLSYFSTIADGRIIWLTYFYMLLIVYNKTAKTKKVMVKTNK